MEAEARADEPYADILLELSKARERARAEGPLDELAYARGYRDGLDFALGNIRAKSAAREAPRTLVGASARTELFESIVKASPDVIAITNLKSEILLVSQSVEKMFGRSEAELLGHPITDFIVTQDQERARSRIDLMFQGIMTGPGEYRGIHKKGAIFTIEVNAEIIRDSEQRPTMIVFIIRDSS